MYKEKCPKFNQIYPVSHENEILSQRGFDWTSWTPSESAPVKAQYNT